MSFEVKVKRLGQRDWNDVKSAWMPHIAQLSIETPGQRPSERPQDFLDTGGISPLVPEDGEYRCDVPGLRSAMLHEAIYLLHKASNVLVATHQQVRGGLPTWSVATAYQSAFFSQESLLMLLGVAFIEVNNKTLLVDAWPEIEKSASKKAKSAYKIGSEFQFVHHKRIEHHHRWAILKRALRMLLNSPIPASILNAIEDIDDKQFARQRNNLHYSNTWLFEDLHSFTSPVDYCRFLNPPALVSRLTPDNSDFTVVLATLLFSSATSLLASLGAIAPTIANEYSLLNQSSATDRMLLRSDFEQSMATSLV